MLLLWETEVMFISRAFENRAINFLFVFVYFLQIIPWNATTVSLLWVGMNVKRIRHRKPVPTITTFVLPHIWKLKIWTQVWHLRCTAKDARIHTHAARRPAETFPNPLAPQWTYPNATSIAVNLQQTCAIVIRIVILKPWYRRRHFSQVKTRQKWLNLLKEIECVFLANHLSKRHQSFNKQKKLLLIIKD